MTLATSQTEFMAHVLDEDHALPVGWTERHAQGLAIYRNNYRSALVEALQSTFERTAIYVGDDAFRRAAAHHLITRPPNSWTLDRAGKGFPDTARDLFKTDTEVAELAWLEWAMHCAFVATDANPLDAAGFAAGTAQFGEADWSGMRLAFVPGIDQRQVTHDIPALWRSNSESQPEAEPVEPQRLDGPCHLLVWREGLTPVFRLIDLAEGEALAAMRGGASYGDACALLCDTLGEAAAIAQAGAMLGRWLHDGLVIEVSSPAAPE